MNRLKLNFSLNTTEERTAFLHEYLAQSEFQSNPPSPEELETFSNYILWGKDSDGKNGVQKKNFEIETRYKTWNNRDKEESLDALLETPTFNEQTILPPIEATPRHKREVFDRRKALKTAPEEVKLILKRLFREIDELDLLLSFYDESHGKRKNGPRLELLEPFSEEEINTIRARSQKLSQYQYLKLRHLLVEKRKEQYSYKDTYSEPLQSILPPLHTAPETTIIGEDIPVFPLGVKNKEFSYFFPNFWNIEAGQYTEKQLEELSKQIWGLKARKNEKFYFSFLEEEHVYKLLLAYLEIDEEESSVESLAPELISTLEYYIEMADLNSIQKEILELKIKKKTNIEIAAYINEKYQRSYTINYISTIFKQQIVKKISTAAALHLLVMENLFFPENFKKCSRCGAVLLKDAEFFMRKSRSRDGFSSCCKHCDRLIRGGYKN